MDYFRWTYCILDASTQVHFRAPVRSSWASACRGDMDYLALATIDFWIFLADILVGCSQRIFVCPSSCGFGSRCGMDSQQKIKNANDPVDLIPVPPGLSAYLLLIPLRGQEECRKQAGIGHWGRSAIYRW